METKKRAVKKKAKKTQSPNTQSFLCVFSDDEDGEEQRKRIEEETTRAEQQHAEEEERRRLEQESEEVEQRRREQAQEEARRAAEEARKEAAMRAAALLKDKLRMQLKEATEARPVDIDKLRDAVELCDEAGLAAETVDAKELLQQEGVRQANPVLIRLVATLNAAMAARPVNLELIEVAIEAAASSGVADDEAAAARKLVAEKLARQSSCRAALVDVFEQYKETDCAFGRADPDVVGEAVKAVKLVIFEASDAWIAEAELHDAELLRKKLHNALQDLKGAIRVYCRVRPALEREAGNTMCVEVTDSISLRVNVPAETGAGSKAASVSKPRFHDFTFDSIFSAGASQDDVFHDCTDLVQSAVDGHNITIFAYGQTGAGKTFTMYGSDEHPGVAPCTIQEVFRKCAEDSQRFQFTVKASMLELYNNDLVDLLAPKGKAEKPQIRLDAAGHVNLQNVIEKSVAGAEALRTVLRTGHERRRVASTAMNSDSSRSHLILIIILARFNKQTGEVNTGRITLVDLAGSERVKRSQVSGESLKEAIEINKSLTALGDVIEALSQGTERAVVPYRNHKLTQLLQSAIGGTSKTLMFVNIAPVDTSRDETLMSLRYAQRAKTVAPKKVKTVKKKAPNASTDDPKRA
eukprot:TRINITY_DN58844_c0_g1_i1.p1 TRINITY_DN58844_c0_g1~~TRINITY_DN58844_c0_g1_i1.p1  ORF type:complete len:676 (+),score=164.57 TRINITY_DN58844_c0_g1_i1:118-2028(+)